MPQTQKAIPASRVYSLLKSAKPGELQGRKTNGASQQNFQAIIDAAKKARTAREFEKMLNGGGAKAVGGCGAITELIVEYPGDGTVRISIATENCPPRQQIYAGYDL